jgi:hypothetical protein
MRKAFILSFEHIGVEHTDCVEQKCVTLGGGGAGRERALLGPVHNGGPQRRRRRGQGAPLKPDESDGCSPVSFGRAIRLLLCHMLVLVV